MNLDKTNNRAPPPAIANSNVELANDAPTFKKDGKIDTPADAIDSNENVLVFATTAFVSNDANVDSTANMSLN